MQINVIELRNLCELAKNTKMCEIEPLYQNYSKFIASFAIKREITLIDTIAHIDKREINPCTQRQNKERAFRSTTMPRTVRERGIQLSNVGSNFPLTRTHKF